MRSDLAAAECRVGNPLLLSHVEQIDLADGKVFLQCTDCGWKSEPMTQYQALYPPAHNCSSVTLTR